MATEGFEGQVVIVTGASRGVGLALARGFGAAGARVAVVSTTEEGSAAAADEVRRVGGEGLPLVADLGDESNAGSIVDQVVGRWGRLDVLVNNAGLLRPHLAVKITLDELDEVVAVNFRGPFVLCQKAFPFLVERGGCIVNVSALAALRGMDGIGAYAASKAAMLAMTRTMAREWGPRGVRVNAVVPGGVATDMILPKDTNTRKEFVADLSSQNALGRLAEPEELVGPVLFLAGEQASYVTGHALHVDGGSFG